MATDLNTNDLYNMIAANKAEADKVAALAKGTPTFQENFGSTLRSQDQTLSSAVGNYSDAVAELFAHDKNMAASNTTPSFAPEGYVANPMTKEAYSADLFAQRGQRVASSLKTLESRKALLGDIIDKAVKMYESATKGKQLDYEASKDQFASALQLLQFEETKRKNLADEALSRTQLGVTAQKLADAKTNMIEDIKNGATVDDIMNTYAASLSESDIVKLYESNTNYGKIKESSGEIHRKYLAAKSGNDSRDILSTLPNSQQKPIIDGTKSLKLGTDILTAIKEDMGDKAPNFFKAMANKNYGLARRLIQPYLSTGKIGILIDASQAATRQLIYGSAFTETEAALARKWLTESGDASNQIWVKLLGQQDAGENQIRTALKARRISDKEINDYLDFIGYRKVDSSSTGGVTLTGNTRP